MAMPSRPRQLSDAMASIPKKKGKSSRAPDAKELQQNITDLLGEFESLHHVERLPLTDEKLIIIRQNIEKLMPHLYQITNKSGPPYPSKRICELKDMAENCLREFNVDLDSLRPSPKVNVAKTVPAIPFVGVSGSGNGSGSSSVSGSSEVSGVGKGSAIEHNTSHCGMGTTAIQQTLLCSVHDVVEKLTYSWIEPKNESGTSNIDENYWMEAPVALSPDEIQSLNTGAGEGGHHQRGTSGGGAIE